MCSPTFPSPGGVTPSPRGQRPAPHFLSLAGEGPAVKAAGLLGSTPDSAGWGSPRSCWGVTGFVFWWASFGTPPRQVSR